MINSIKGKRVKEKSFTSKSLCLRSIRKLAMRRNEEKYGRTGADKGESAQ
jgi:hypothetical protein